MRDPLRGPGRKRETTHILESKAGELGLFTGCADNILRAISRSATWSALGLERPCKAM